MISWWKITLTVTVRWLRLVVVSLVIWWVLRQQVLCAVWILSKFPNVVIASGFSVGGQNRHQSSPGKIWLARFGSVWLVFGRYDHLKTLPPHWIISRVSGSYQIRVNRRCGFLAGFETHMTSLRTLDLNLLAQAVLISCQHKADIVAQDGLKPIHVLLNFGHTLGMWIETHEGYSNWLHGEAVAVGMIQAMQLSQKNKVGSARMMLTEPVL